MSFSDLYRLSSQITKDRLSIGSLGGVVGWQEVVFFLCENPMRWRFMGVSINVFTPAGEPQEVVSSIFRHDATEEIPCPWPEVCLVIFSILGSIFGGRFLEIVSELRARVFARR